jgi:hypothetical protein
MPMNAAGQGLNCDLIGPDTGPFPMKTISVTGAIGVTLPLLLYPTYSTFRIVGTDIAHTAP